MTASPSSSPRPTSRSCAAPRTPRRSCSRRRLSASRPSASPTATRSPASCAPMWRRRRRHPARRRRALDHHRRLRGGLPSDRPRRLWPAVPLADGRQPARAEGRMPSVVRRDSRGPGRADLHRHAAARSRALLRRTPRGAGFSALPDAFILGASFLYRGDERRRLGELAELAAQVRAPLVATNDVLYHDPARRPLADVLTCIREKCTIAEAGYRLEANAERHLKAGAEMARLFARLSGGRRAHARDRGARPLFAGDAAL